MNIIVPIKQVPATEKVEIDEQTNNLKRSPVSKINNYDRFALESALRIANQLDDQVIAVTMGPQNADQVLAEAIGMGASQGILLSDRAFAGADTLATAYTLAKGIEKIDDIRLVVVGQQAEDADTGQVGPLIAKQLHLVQATYVSEIKNVQKDTIEIQRVMGQVDIDEVITYPALLTISDKFAKPRYILSSNIMSMKTNQIVTWHADDLAIDKNRIGVAGSPSVVRKILLPTGNQRRLQDISGDSNLQAAEIKTIIQESLGQKIW